MQGYNFISIAGMCAFMLTAWLLSSSRRTINWRVVVWGVTIQIIFAFLVFKFPVGIRFFEWLNSAVIKFISFSKSGIYFLFGPLAVAPRDTGPGGEASLGFILATQVLPTVIFFSALVSLLYHLRVMHFIISIFSRMFTTLMRISGAESLCSASNIFVGIESAIAIRPYLADMTESELCTVLTAGMATIASSVLALYVMILREYFPMIAGHLISASILSAPAAIVMSKLIYPEKGKPLTLAKSVQPQQKRYSNWIEAVITGAMDGVRLCVGISALLLSFLGLLAMLNWAVGKLTGGLSIQLILGYIFRPFCFILGMPWKDATLIATLLGERVVLTELVSYKHLAELIANGTITNPRSILLATYSLCGFTHIASLAIFIGGISALAPQKIGGLSKVGFRALISASLATLMTAAVAGIFHT